MTNTRVDSVIFDAQMWADKSVAAFGAFDRQADQVRLEGCYPPDAGDEQRVAAEVVKYADILASPKGVNLVIEAAQRIERKVLPSQFWQVYTFHIG